MISNPSSSRKRIVFLTDACSTLVVIICLPARWFASAVPMIARLFDSVPPEVNTISFSWQRSVFAMAVAASLTYFSASTPFICIEDGFPKSTVNASTILFFAASEHLVVAELSRYASIVSILPPFFLPVPTSAWTWHRLPPYLYAEFFFQGKVPLHPAVMYQSLLQKIRLPAR